MVLPGCAELHCRSNFSFLTGASHPAELVQRAQALGYAALAITDECSLAGVVRAHLEAQRCGAHLIIGADMRLTAGAGQGVVDGLPRTGPHLVSLTQTRRGYGDLSRWITVARRRAAKGAYLAHASDLADRVPNAPFLAGRPEWIALLVPGLGRSFETVFAHVMGLKAWFADRAFIAIELLHRAGEQALLEGVRRVAELTVLQIVASGDVLMHLRSRKALQDTLTAARLATPVAQCGPGLRSNAEPHLRSRGRLAALYEPQWLANTLVVAGCCSFSVAQLRYECPREIVPAGHTP